MTEKEVRKLSRLQLLEILVEQANEIEQLKAELKETKEQLADRKIVIEQSGSLAEAALRMNGVFEAAQRAADQYLENILHRDSED